MHCIGRCCFIKQGGKGGSHTNLHGLKFESVTDLATSIVRDLSKEYELKPHIFKKAPLINSKLPVYDVYRLKDHKMIGIIAKQIQFYNILQEQYDLKNNNYKYWKPDEAFFNFEVNTIFIVEKKWQNTAGSVDEKIFGFVNKRRLYQNNLNQLTKEPKPTVQFSALFNSSWWLKGHQGKNGINYQDYFNSLRIDGIKIFFDRYEYWWFGL